MDCLTIKKGADCIFMGKNGCSFNGGSCHSIVEECNGCVRAVEFLSGWFCSTCPDPAVKWENGKCNLATHVSTEIQKGTNKVNPLKASKRKTK